MKTDKKASKKLNADRSLTAVRKARRRRAVEEALAAWAMLWVTLQLDTLPIKFAAEFKKKAAKRTLSLDQRREYKSLAEFWDKIASLPLAKRAAEFEYDLIDVLVEEAFGGNEEAFSSTNLMDDLRCQIEASVYILSKGAK